MHNSQKYFKKEMHKLPFERCSAVFTKISLKNQRLLYKSAAYLKHSRRSTMEYSCENSGFQSSTIFAK